MNFFPKFMASVLTPTYEIRPIFIYHDYGIIRGV